MTDYISRQAAIALADSLKDELSDDDRAAYCVMAHNEGILEYQTALSLLPSAQPERKHGYWVESQEHVYMGNSVKEWTNWYCSECDAPNDKPSDFCPSCGADMRGEQDG